MSNSDNIDNQEAVKLEAQLVALCELVAVVLHEESRATDGSQRDAADMAYADLVGGWSSRKVLRLMNDVRAALRTTPAKLDAPDNQEALAGEGVEEDLLTRLGHAYQGMIGLEMMGELNSHSRTWMQSIAEHKRAVSDAIRALSRTPSSPQADEITIDGQRFLRIDGYDAPIDQCLSLVVKGRRFVPEAQADEADVERISREVHEWISPGSPYSGENVASYEEVVRKTLELAGLTRPAGGEEVERIDQAFALFIDCIQIHIDNYGAGGRLTILKEQTARAREQRAAALTKPAALPKEGEESYWLTSDEDGSNERPMTPSERTIWQVIQDQGATADEAWESTCEIVAALSSLPVSGGVER